MSFLFEQSVRINQHAVTLPVRDQSACVASSRLNHYQALADTIKLKQRHYLDDAAELRRSHDIRNHNHTLMFDPKYKSILNDNLWNEKGRLSPQLQRYVVELSPQSKRVADLPKI